MADDKQPTQQEFEKAQQVSVAAAEAAQAAEPADKHEAAKQAARAEADRVQLDLPDEVIEKIADMVSDKNIAKLEQRGAFDAQIEPVQAPPQPTAPPPPGEPAQPTPEQAPQPVKRTFAHRFMGQ